MIKQLLFYEIPRRSTTCSAGLEPFKEGMTYHSLLEETPEGVVLRKDYCSDCWENRDRDSPHPIHWASKVPKSLKVDNTPLARDDKSLELIKSGECDPEEMFVLALYLARRKKIAFRQEISGKLVYEILATEEMIAIPKIPLTQVAILATQSRLLQKFNPK